MFISKNSVEKNILLLLFVGLLLNGCSSSPLSRYPGFLMDKSQSTSGMIMADVAVIDNLRGQGTKMDIVANGKTAQMCLNVLAGKLNEKGYHINRTLISSMGMGMNANDVYKIVRDESEENDDVQSLNVASPPFYVNNLVFSDSTSRHELQALVLRLLNSSHKENEPEIQIPEAESVGKQLGGGLMFMLFVRGFNVPVATQNGSSAQPESMSDTKIAFQYTSEVSTTLYVFDSETGNIVWDDRIARKGGVVFPGKIFDMLNKLVDELP